MYSYQNSVKYLFSEKQISIEKFIICLAFCNVSNIANSTAVYRPFEINFTNNFLAVIKVTKDISQLSWSQWYPY